jgi:hypothetical protein
MSLKARLNRLDAEVEWLRWSGRLRAVELQMDLVAAQRARTKVEEKRVDAAKAEARRREAARREALEQVKRRLEPPPPPVPPKPSPVAEAVRAEEPAERPFNYDPPEHMQIRPVTWRIRGPDVYDGGGKCLVDYDVLASEDDDDD